MQRARHTRRRNYAQTPKAKQKKSYVFRIVFIGVLFTVISLFYITKLVNIQITGRDQYTSSTQKTYTRTVVLRAQRGEIFDRNGKPLVTNSSTYDLVFDYGSLSRYSSRSNPVILSAVSAMKETGNYEKRVESNFVFLGEYPNLIYNPTLLENEKYKARFNGILKAYELDEDISAEELVEFYVKRFGLNATDENDVPLYTDEEKTELLRVRFDMDYSKFSVSEPYVLARDVNLTLITVIKESELRGVTFSENVKRKYEYPGYASHILGRVGEIQKEDLEYYSEKGYKMNAVVGTDGCEKAFEEYLHGTDGTMVIEEDAYGNIVNQYVSKEPVSGNDVWLTIDIDVQIAAENALKSNIEYIVNKANSKAGNLDGEDAKSGAITAVSAKTGDIYAIASYPTYDLSTFYEDYQSLLNDEATPLFNRALSGTFQPGSTFKVGVAIAALEEGIINPSTVIADKGRYTYYDKNGPRCWIYLQKGTTHGTINVIEAIQVSCNYFFYDIGRQLTAANITKYAKQFGLGEHTGIELDEKTGVLAGPEYREEHGAGEWYPGDTLQASIGQSDHLFTPLQISNYISTVVNGGTRYSSHLLGSVRKFFTNEIVSEYEPKVLNSVNMSDTTYKTIMKAMKSVTENGSPSRIFTGYPFAIGGKTGTAQVSKTKSDNAIFTAFAPYNDPEIVCTCIIEQGNTGADAGYAIKTVFDSYFKLGEYAVTEN